METSQQSDRIPNCLAEENDRRRSHSNANERVERHRRRQTERLPGHLCLLRFCVAGEVGDVQRDRSPEPNHRRKRRNKSMQELTRGFEFAGRAEHGTEAARFSGDPEQKQESNAQHERRADSFQKLDRLDPAPNDEHIQKPKSEKACPRNSGMSGQGRPEHAEHRIDCLTANPSLNSKPSASDERAQDSGNICPANAERSPDINRERNSVFRSRVRVQNHRHEDYQIAEKNCSDGLLPAHTGRDQAGSQHVGGNADAHCDPQREDIGRKPLS